LEFGKNSRFCPRDAPNSIFHELMVKKEKNVNSGRLFGQRKENLNMAVIRGSDKRNSFRGRGKTYTKMLRSKKKWVNSILLGIIVMVIDLGEGKKKKRRFHNSLQKDNGEILFQGKGGKKKFP